jgi:ssDNA-binding Zn-finger/Zn-ribbon topoisomerase 1
MVDPDSNTYPALDAPAGTDDNLTLFVCPACGQRARVPKMFAGHSIKCPKCKTTQAVAELADQTQQGGTILLRRPQEVTDAIAAEAKKKADEAAAPAAGDPAAPALVMPAPSALMPKNIAEPAPVPAADAAPAHTGPTIPFHCTKCLTESAVPAEYAGKVIKCPKCQAVQIALAGVAPMTGMFAKPKSAFAAAEPAAAAPTLAGAPAKTAVVDDRGRIVFTCGACRFSAYFAQSYGGKPIQCPACGTAQTIDPLPGQMVTPTTSAAAAAHAGSGSGAAPVIGAGGVVISSGRQEAPIPAQAHAPQPLVGTGRIHSPAPHPPGSVGTGRVPNSQFSTPLPGSLNTPSPGQALTSRHKAPVPAPAPMSLANSPGVPAPVPPPSVPATVPPAPSALVPIVNVPAPAPAPVIVHVPGPAPRGTLIMLCAICVVLVAVTAWMLQRSTELATKRDDLMVQLKQATDVTIEHDRNAVDQVAAAMSAKTVAERSLAMERDAHQIDAAALAAATAQLAAAKTALADALAEQQRMKDIDAGRDKMEVDLRSVLTGPDEDRAKLVDQLTQSLVLEVAAREAAERKVRELSASAAAAK